jgi:hypothetical protein
MPYLYICRQVSPLSYDHVHFYTVNHFKTKTFTSSKVYGIQWLRLLTTWMYVFHLEPESSRSLSSSSSTSKRLEVKDLKRLCNEMIN